MEPSDRGAQRPANPERLDPLDNVLGAARWKQPQRRSSATVTVSLWALLPVVWGNAQPTLAAGASRLRPVGPLSARRPACLRYSAHGGALWRQWDAAAPVCRQWRTFFPPGALQYRRARGVAVDAGADGAATSALGAGVRNLPMGQCRHALASRDRIPAELCAEASTRIAQSWRDSHAGPAQCAQGGSWLEEGMEVKPHQRKCRRQRSFR